MIKSLLFIFLFFFLSACSFKTPANQFEHKSATAFSSYTKNFLEGNDVLASNDLTRAVKHAKKSADLTNLAKIYLGECALNISVGVPESCEKYKNIQILVDDKALESYYQLLTSSLLEEDIHYLANTYQDYAHSALHLDTTHINKTILHIDRITSLLICASLSKEMIDSTTKELIIQKASHYGYKKAVLFWLEESLKSADSSTKRLIQKKIDIMRFQ